MKMLSIAVLLGGVALTMGACTTTEERIGGAGVGALAGAAVAGPVGAAVGGVAGAVTGPQVSHAVGVSKPVRKKKVRRVRTTTTPPPVQ